MISRGSGVQDKKVLDSGLPIESDLRIRQSFTFFLRFCETSCDRNGEKFRVGRKYSLRTIQRNAEGLVHAIP